MMNWLGLIPLFPLLGALLNGGYALNAASRKKPVSRVFVNCIGVGFPLLAFIFTVISVLPFFQGEHEPQRLQLFQWISLGSFQVSASLYLDRLSSIMTLIITGVGTLIHLYSTGYMKEDPGYAKYFAYLNLFLFSMLMLVLGENLILLFLGWEGVGLCSYLLIGFWFDDPAKAAAGKKAFIVNRIGDFGFLIGIFIILMLVSAGSPESVSTLGFDNLRAQAGLLAPMATVITLFLFLGATGKSAQIPLYIWLPDAMAGPTPVSALIHAATMVTAGIYMIARLDFLFTLAPFTLNVIAIIGAATALMAATIALVQNDIKKVLAYSTVSQLGYMFLAMGVGAYSAGVFHLMTHAFFKACLFLGSGSVIHALSGEQDLRKMGGLKKALPITCLTFLFATLAISGIPPFAGFFSKDEILWETFRRGHTILWALGLVTAAMTSFYMFRLFALCFLGSSRVSEEAKHHLHESPKSMTFPLVVLAALSLGGGLVGIPEVLGGNNSWHHWLHLGIEAPENIWNTHSWELILIVASVAVAAIMAWVALKIYQKKSDKIVSPEGFVSRLLQNKYYVDEIYQLLIVQPLQSLSQSVLFRTIDQKLIDGVLVNGSARLSSFIGSLFNRLQNGQLNNYLLYFFVVFCLMGIYWVGLK